MQIKKILNSKWCFLGLLPIIGFLTFSLTRELNVRHASIAKIDTIKQEIGELEKRESELTKLKDYYNSKEFLEKEARSILSYQKPGEEVYVVIPKNSNVQESSNAENNLGIASSERLRQIGKESSNLNKWWNYFFNARD
jgi:cell division protein FtsB